ncbi:acyltransferase family protein [Anaerosacchariphilus polymeriproducens]|uniref:Acyltransferase n=1 Tax=Anaerosacchariphilus polymeriproducens TaxID=1812858 RepID=A0A371AYP7_9FIRM|nr:acyltransferase [Anaerosacchariphilus polymeriproducens]RDU24600.1 acyltransferase [Anaerosacchariphilus polymeriproducens]
MINNDTNVTIAKRNMRIDYFRAFLMVLVVWHHATLAYSTTGSGVLITDDSTFMGFDLIALFNDSFFMFAFFFVSGLFSYKSLLKKGIKNFFEERLIRLLLPFAFATLLINPIAHYFSSLNKNGGSFSIVGYFQFLINTFGKTESNHLWFLWVLFFFSLILAIYHLVQKVFSITIRRSQEKYLTKAWTFTVVMVILGTLCYLPMCNIGEGGFVTLLKPFNMQVSRVLIYFLYFVAGNVIGMYGIQRSFLYKEKFQKKWWLWLSLSLATTVLNIVVHVVQENMEIGILKNTIIVVDQGMIVVISLFALFGFISFFTLHIKEDNKVINLLSKEAMGIYIIHYAVVTALQYAFTFVELSAVEKGITTTLMTMIISLSLVIALKKVPVIGCVFGKAYNHKYDRGLIILTLIMMLLLIFL